MNSGKAREAENAPAVDAGAAAVSEGTPLVGRTALAPEAAAPESARVSEGVSELAPESASGWNGASGQDGVSGRETTASVGLGIDLVDIARMKGVLERTPRFAQKVFSPDERAYCDARAHPEAHYATRFAAKEAVVKALGTGFAAGMTVRDIELVLNAKGAPRVVLRGRVAEVAREQGVVSMPVSLSFTHTEAVACALALTSGDAVPSKRRAEDPLRELDARFKEARALLDDL